MIIIIFSASNPAAKPGKRGKTGYHFTEEMVRTYDNMYRLHTYTHSLSLSFSLVHTPSQTRTHTLFPSHTLAHTHSHSLSLTHTLSLSHSLSLSHTHFLTLSHTLTLIFFLFQDAKLLIAVTDLIKENAQNAAPSTLTDEDKDKNIMYLFDWVEIAER